MLFGIRPEDLFLPGQLRNGANIAEIDMKVSGVETLGAETVLIFEVEGLHQAIFVKADRFTRVRRGDRIQVMANLSAARLFDPQSNQVLINNEANQ